MLSKELRQGMRRGSFVVPFIAIHVLAVVCLVFDIRSGAGKAPDSFGGLINPILPLLCGPLWQLAAAVCGVLMPLGGLFLMSQELEEGNHELLQLTPLDRWRVVIGKVVTLWGMAAVTLFSLLPYVVCRYLAGGIEWWNEAGCFLSVLMIAAVMTAGSVGASAARSLAGKIPALFAFVFAAGFGCAVPMLMMGWRGYGVMFHFTGVAVTACYVMFGLALARSSLRVALLAYETKPSVAIMGLLLTSPFALALGSGISLGYGGGVLALLLGVAAFYSDRTPGELSAKRKAMITPAPAPCTALTAADSAPPEGTACPVRCEDRNDR
ncbi:MAG: hypothetical protein V4733_07810 [Verrucomicrobiota bacterium]